MDNVTHKHTGKITRIEEKQKRDKTPMWILELEGLDGTISAFDQEQIIELKNGDTTTIEYTITGEYKNLKQILETKPLETSGFNTPREDRIQRMRACISDAKTAWLTENQPKALEGRADIPPVHYECIEKIAVTYYLQETRR